ncbi:MAG: nucleotide exchange factor GrpE [Myxococcota bacterium]
MSTPSENPTEPEQTSPDAEAVETPASEAAAATPEPNATPEPHAPEAEAAEPSEDADIIDAEIVEEDGASGDDAEEPAAEVIELDPLMLQAELAMLRGQNASLKKDNEELTGRLRSVSKAYKQQQDDVAATRKRLERQANEREARRRGEVVKELFEPLQNLRRSKELMEKAEIGESHVQGIDMVIHQIMGAFERLGMEEVPGKGAKFDPNLHEALTMMPVQDPALDEVVVEVFEAGYRIGSRLIRPARVIVGSYTAPEEPAGEA